MADFAPDFRDLSYLNLRPDHEKRPIWVLPNRMVLLEAFSPSYRIASEFLIAIAEVRMRPSLIHEFEINSSSLYSAISLQHTTETIINILDQLSKNTIPKGVRQFIQEHTQHYEKTRLTVNHANTIPKEDLNDLSGNGDEDNDAEMFKQALSEFGLPQEVDKEDINLNVKQKDLNCLSDDEDNDAELFQKAILEDALAQEGDKAKFDQYSDSPSNTHYFTRCNGCQVSPIVGVRYKCTVCPNFNYCEKCEKTKEHSHNFVKMKECDDFDAFKYELKNKKLSVKPVEWMEFDPNTDSLVQELFNIRKNALNKNYQERVLKENIVSKDEMKSFNLPQKSEEKKHAPSLEELERIQIDEKIAGLLEYFPYDNFSILSSFVRGAPKDLSVLELKDRFQIMGSLWKR